MYVCIYVFKYTIHLNLHILFMNKVSCCSMSVVYPYLLMFMVRYVCLFIHATHKRYGRGLEGLSGPFMGLRAAA